jgi:hypothetical protein
MKAIDCIKFVDDATGCGVSVSVYQREDAMVLIDVQFADKPASIVSLPNDLARRLGGYDSGRYHLSAYEDARSCQGSSECDHNGTRYTAKT